MRIQEYIDRYHLSLWRKISPHDNSPSWNPVFLTDPDDPKDRDKRHWAQDVFEVFANPDKTLLVSINTKRRQFRIVHHEMIVFYSKWESIDPDFKIEPLD